MFPLIKIIHLPKGLQSLTSVNIRLDQHPTRTFAASLPPPMTTQQIGEYVSREVTGSVIDLSVGQPSPALLPLSVIQAAAADRLGGGDRLGKDYRRSASDNSPIGGYNSNNATLLLQYGPRQGYPSFRHDLAAFLNGRYNGHVVDPDNLMATAGISHGLDLVCGNLSRPGDIILTEQPTYFLARRIFEGNHLEVLGLPTDADGVDTNALEEMLVTWPLDRPRPKLLYTVPVHNNPSAATLSHQRRQHLINLAHQYSFTVIADEVYQMLSFPGEPEPPPPLRFYELQHNRDHQNKQESSGGVISLGSFSKILAPGLRLGWIEAGPSAMTQLKMDGAINSGGCIASLSCGIAHSALQMGLLQGHLDNEVKPALSRQCEALTSALRENLPNCHFLQPKGGYFLWLKLPHQISDSRQLLKHAEATQAGVRFTPGSVCGGDPGCIRLCFAFYSPAELKLGAARLAKAIKTFN